MSLHGRNFDLQQYQIVENGRPKQLHLRAAEIKEVSVTGKALFEASDDNFRELVKLNQDKDHAKKVMVGGCFDGGSPYQGDIHGVKGLRIAANPSYRGKHDRMHIQNLVYKDFISQEQFYVYSRVVEDYRSILAYFSTSTKKLRMLKVEEVDLDILKEIDRADLQYKAELEKLAKGNVEVMFYLDSLHRQHELEEELRFDEVEIEQLIFANSKLKTVEERSAELEQDQEILRTKSDELEKLAKKNAERKIRAHKLTRIFEIRMVNGVYKSLKMLERRYEAHVRFFKNEVDENAEGSLLCLRILISFSSVCRFLSLLDITETLTKALCLEQIGSVTVLHLETLNNRLFEALDQLIDTDVRAGEDIITRLGPHLAKHAKDLCKSPPEFNGIILKVRGRRKSKKDQLSGIRNLQKRASKFLKKEMKKRLALNEYEQACQSLLHTRRSDCRHFDETLDGNLDILIRANINFVGGDSRKQKIENGLRKLIKLFKKNDFTKFISMEVLDVYEVIWTQRRYWKELGPETMAIIECVLADPHSCANCERGDRVLKQIITASRQTMYELTVDAEMRIAMNGPHERMMKWRYFSRRWLKVLSKSSPLLIIDNVLEGSKSRAVAKEKNMIKSKEYRDLKCSFYNTLPLGT